MNKTSSFLSSGFKLKDIDVESPVVLAPMAGITNAPFRRLCRNYGGGLYVTEMVTSRALVERNEESMRIISHDDDEKIRSVQLYGVDSETIAAAIKIIVDEDRADHIDLNFGCPVPKVTRKGGGAALPWKKDLFKDIVTGAVKQAEVKDIPLTIKMRKGIDDDHLTYLDAASIARSAGVSAIALHGRTASQYYSGKADWEAIAQLRDHIPDIPVLGNGDIWAAEDAVKMMQQTGVDGVVIGRGCQGRPWLFGDLEAAFSGSDQRIEPTLKKVVDTVLEHAKLLRDFFGSELMACRDIRKHISWYFKGYPVGGKLRRNMAMVESITELENLLNQLDLDTSYPGADSEGPRGRAGAPKKTVLPDKWLDSQTIAHNEKLDMSAAESDVSGG